LSRKPRGIIPFVVEAYARMRYRLRRVPGVVYAHYLDEPVYAAISELTSGPGDMNGYMIVGELIHAGVEALLGPVEMRCRRVRVEPRAVVPGAEVFLGEDGSVEVCGTADALVDGVPVEVKTTRLSRKPLEKWRRRAALYAWLYGSPAAYLAVINVVSGDYREYRVDALDTGEVKRMLEDWLAGLFPRRVLETF